MAARPPDPAALLSPEFLAQLRLLREHLFRRRSRGDLRGAGFGPTPEFDTHRPYEPGDDPRSIDWNVYARTDKLLLKLFLREEESRVCVLLDTSESMRIGAGRKAAMAARFAAAFSYLALVAGRPLVVGAFAERCLATTGMLRAPEHFREVLRFVSAAPMGRATRFGPSLAEFLAAHRGRSLVIVVSDFFQEEDVVPEIAWLHRRGHQLRLAQIVEARELLPVLRGSCAVHDVEGEEQLNLLAGNDFLAELRVAVAAYLDQISAACRGLLVPYALVHAEQPFERAFIDHLVVESAG